MLRARLTLMVALAATLSATPAGQGLDRAERVITTDAISRAIARLPPVRLNPTGQSADWSAVRGLASGSKILVTTQAGTRIVYLVQSEDDAMIILDVAAMPASARDRLIALARTEPGRLAAVSRGGPFEDGTLRLSGAGVFYDGRRLADLERVLARVPRPEVIEIALRRRGSVKGAVIGASVGAGLGFLFALELAYKDCGGNCSDERVLMGLSLVGLPAGLGWVGYRAGERSQVVYRRP